MIATANSQATSGPETFTVAQLATALGRTSRSVRRSLEGTPPEAVAVAGGRSADAWTLAGLPHGLRRALHHAANTQGFADEETLLNVGRNRWEPPVPLANIRPADLDAARKLKAALEPVLTTLNDAMTPDAAQGLELFQRVHGYAVTQRHWNRLFNLVVNRDRGNGEWERIELYLSNNAFRKGSTTGETTEVDFFGIRTVLNAIKNPLKPTRREVALFWSKVSEAFECATESGENEREARRTVCAFVEEHAAFINATGESLEKQFRRKLARWQKGGRNSGALLDRRPKNSGRGRFTPDLPESIREKLIIRAVNCGGGVSQAWRELWDERALPAHFSEYYERASIPRKIRDSVIQDARIVATRNIGPKEAKLKGPKLVRTWEGVPSGMEAQSDDCTLPVYFFVSHPDTGFKLIRGQFLPWIDTRSGYIYTFQLIAKESYNSEDIVRGVARLNDVWGLPERLYFERGIWEKSAIIKGGKSAIPFGENISGLEERLGIRISHALDPSAKIVERVLGALQDRMNSVRGYCGRNEREDCPEHLIKAKYKVERGQAHPSEYFYGFQEWTNKLEEIVDRYNDDPQHGKRHQGKSPRQVFVENLPSTPPVRLDANARHLVATHRRDVKVTAQGVNLKIGQRKYVYRGPETGRLQGQTVQAWFDLEDPSQITLTDAKGRNPASVPRATEIKAIGAGREEMTAAQQEKAAHTEYGNTLWGALKKKHPEEFANRGKRPIQMDADGHNLGQFMQDQKVIQKTKNREKNRVQERVRRLDRKTGLRPFGDRSRQNEKLQALENLEEIFEREETE